MASEDPKVSKQGTAGKKKCMALKIPQKLDIIRTFGIGESRSVLLASYSIGLLTVYDTEKQKEQLQLFMASNESVNEPSKVTL